MINPFVLVLLLLLFDRCCLLCGSIEVVARRSERREIRIGIEIERDEGYPHVTSRDRIAVLTNPSGVFPDNLEHIVDVLNREFPM